MFKLPCDAILCLSLDKREDRRTQLLQNLPLLSCVADVPLRFWRARPPSEVVIPDWWPHWPSYYACGLDHQAMLAHAYLSGMDRVFILEDDALPLQSGDESIKLAMGALPPDWMGVWFGGWHWKTPLQINPHVKRLTRCGLTHAYYLNRRGMHRVLSHLTHEIKVIVDHATAGLHQIEPHFYAPSEWAIAQGPSYSDHEKKDKPYVFNGAP